MKNGRRINRGKSTQPARDYSTLAWFSWLIPTLVAVLTFAAFFPTLQNNFVNWDDDKILYDNPFYRGLSWSHLKWMFTTFLMGHYQPLTWLSFAFDYQFWGVAPAGYHLTSLLLHAANAVLFYLVSRRLLSAALSSSSEKANWRLNLGAALSALLFALHPLRVESVVWATERRDVLSGLFYFVTVYIYCRRVESASPIMRSRWLCAAVATYLLSLLSKATAITLPAVLLLLDIYPFKRLTGSPVNWFRGQHRVVLIEKLPFLILAISFAVTALIAQQVTGALKPLDQLGIFSRLLQAGFAYIFYLWKTLWPFALAPIYELPVETGAWVWLFVISTVVTIVLSVGLFLLRRRWPALLAGWTYYLIVLAPVTGVAQSGPQLVADRYSYLACLSWPLLVAGGSLHWWTVRERTSNVPRQFVAVLSVLVTVGLVILTWNQTKIWRSPITLWQHGTAVEPLASIAHYNLGRAYERENNLTQAITSYQRAVTVNPSYSKAYFNLARLLAINGLESEAMVQYRRVLEIRPDHADAHNDLGLLLETRGDNDAALSEFHKAIDSDPEHYKAFFNLAELLAEQGDLPNAVMNYRQAARINPNEAAIQIRLAMGLARQGNMAEATSHFRRAIELSPNDPDAHLLLARSLVAQGKPGEAEKYYQVALRLAKAGNKGPQSSPRNSKLN